MIVITGYLKPSAKTACEIQVLPLKPRCDLDLEMRSKGRNRRPRSQRITYPNHDRMFRISPPSEPVKINSFTCTSPPVTMAYSMESRSTETRPFT